jgi:ABC-type transporter Mla subunit MlaD
MITMKKLISLSLALVMCLSLVACGGESAPAAPSGADKQPAIDAFNATSTVFDELANEINANIDVIPQDLVDAMTDMASLLTEYKELLKQAKSDLMSFQRKYKGLAELEEVFTAIDRLNI